MLSFSGSNPFLRFGLNPENGLSFYGIRAMQRLAKERVKGYSEYLVMEALNMLKDSLKKGFGIKPSEKTMAWAKMIVLICMAISFMLITYATILDIRLKHRELNQTEEPQTVPSLSIM